jgi:chorismate mutase
MFERLNSGRRQRLAEEMAAMKELPERRVDSARVGKSAEAKERRLVPEVIEDFFLQPLPSSVLK